MIVQTNLIPQLRKRLREILSQVIRKVAFDIERMAKEASPVDTGALRASIYVSLLGGGDYDAATSAAEAKGAGARANGKTPKGRSAPKTVPLLEEVKPTDDLTAFVAVGADYGAAVESKQPFLTPAMERARAGFEEAIRQALGNAGK